VIEDLAQYELAATVTLVFSPEGVCCTFDMPATHLTSAGGRTGQAELSRFWQAVNKETGRGSPPGRR
jgi:hypothetical protein